MEFHEIVMEATSPEAMRSFYGDLLELPVVAENEDEVAFRLGATTVRFRRAVPGTAPTYHFAFRVPGNQFSEAKAWLDARTELVRDGDRDEFDWDFWGARAVYAHDAGANIIELMAFPELPPASGKPFGPRSIVGIAELGFPVADPAAAVARLADAFGIRLWERDDVTPDGLTPVGEQGATFLVTRIGRTWLFGDAAAAHPLEVMLGGVAEGTLEFDEHPYRIVGAA
jgi:catechol 2,3-dioxygenase-like lactoylglutathione lyase family enzyme